MRILRSEEFAVSAGGSTDMPVGSTSTYYTDAKKLNGAASVSLSYKATSSGNVKLKIEIEQSWKKPATEYSSDSSYVVAESVSDVESSLADETQHHKGSLGQITLPYIRLKITGLADPDGNDSSTTLNARLNVQEAA